MSNAPSPSRRAFVKGAVVLGATAALAALQRGRRAGPETAPAGPAPAAAGYRLTEHVAKYYEKARG